MGATFYRAFDGMLLELNEQKVQLAQLANKYPLTGLLNLRAGLEAFTVSAARAKRNNSMLAMLFIDLNKFKLINDVHGHVVGDQTLIDIATNLQTQLREYDHAIRVGGDEFIILLNDVTSSEQVLEISDRLVQQLEIKSALTPFITPTISLGIAIYPQDGNTFTELKHKADSAMYQAKEDKLLKICINNKKI